MLGHGMTSTFDGGTVRRKVPIRRWASEGIGNTKLGGSGSEAEGPEATSDSIQARCRTASCPTPNFSTERFVYMY